MFCSFIKIEMCLWLLTEGSRLPITRIGGVGYRSAVI